MKDLLKGLTFGTAQNSGVMTVIPLIGEDVSRGISSVSETKFLRTTNYGSMQFGNLSQNTAIVPSGYTVITKQIAQDHAMPFARLIKPNEQAVFTNGCCVEETQPGFIDGNQVKDFQLLPLHIRKEHFRRFVLNENVSTHDISYSRLWNVISDFQGKLVRENNAHLSFFFHAFVDELNRFNAEFETVPGQRGAIILANNEILGVEILPTQKDWSLVWNKLIRDCYGSEVLRLTKLKLIKAFEETRESSLDLSKCSSLDMIEQTLQEHQQSFALKANEQLVELLGTEHKEHKHLGALMLEDNQHDDIRYSLRSSLGGKTMIEIFEDDNEILYCSLLTA